MLTEQEKDIIKQTVPLLKEKGTEITSIFYPKMFKAHPELLNMFNQTNQKRGMQSSALAQAVMAAAVNIDNLSVIKPVIMPVAYKHCALQVYAEHYPIVGENLLKAIQDVTGLEEHDPVIQAWAKAYGVIADVFIQIEKEIYDQMMWIGFKPFKITNIKQESEDIKSFTVETEEYDFSEFTPGQYITVDVSSDKLPYRAKRHYSIVSGEKNHLTFGVKRDVTTEHEGEVSTILHDEIKEGDMINLAAPVGGFVLENTTEPQLFLGSGIGVTPLVAMYEAASAKGLDTQMVQVAENEQHLPFKDNFNSIASHYDNAKLYTHLKDKQGYIGTEELQAFLANKPEIYICGGTKFLQSMIEALKSLNYDMDRVHYETFIPRLSVAV
ncbi:nitric oxide dioxygenase [Staphylococcus aureus M1423]|jgi:nitric oxide dioxygenase|uniref:nitric oxide dioxygenase n=14 Tax=Staphylococcus aureus TaxID=1280 RepID=A0A3A3AMT4_STAAU|nr:MULTISPECIES: globin domain-containing protein [Staphylococcus]EGL91729.1 putative flavohemoprotein [Staphylococcus aureus subsp. aureus 21318]EHS15175.1 putative flavohemoprotein [Staphylococcus aureus subsp. aureus IS-99]ENK68974.1 nitric oxide dioxygenase [Staphylococcus aureus M0562]EUY48730.1 nitric oxide dioxygenase [Staphylococcus aureus M0406]HAR4216056.1 nitric oxide dioxygenase [Staphylococcus aureus ADL-227]HAR4238171.1 nitric oxide dioxygenase [Staphylococcus aureus ADL-330]HD